MAEQSGGLYSLSLMLGCLVSGIVVLHDKLEASSRMFGATAWLSLPRSGVSEVLRLWGLLL